MTLPLVWTGIFGAFLFGFTLTWNDFDRTALLVVGNLTLPLEIVGLIQAAALRPDLYALGTATTLVSLAVIVTFLVVLTIRSGSGARRCRASRRSWASAAGSTPRPQSRSSRR